MSATVSLSSLLLDEAVDLIRQGMAPLDACRQVGLSFHLYGFLVEARPELARELEQLRHERDLATQRAYRDRMRLAKPPLRLVAATASTEAAFCGQCGGEATVTPGGLVRSAGLSRRCPGRARRDGGLMGRSLCHVAAGGVATHAPSAGGASSKDAY